MAGQLNKSMKNCHSSIKFPERARENLNVEIDKEFEHKEFEPHQWSHQYFARVDIGVVFTSNLKFGH